MKDIANVIELKQCIFLKDVIKLLIRVERIEENGFSS
jgi:hypothetical protein